MQREVRLAYICRGPNRCDPPARIFMLEGEGVPNCPNGHGKMEVQPNAAYKRPASRFRAAAAR